MYYMCVYICTGGGADQKAPTIAQTNNKIMAREIPC